MPQRNASWQQETPYADAVARYADSQALSLMVPGHGLNGLGINERLAEFFGERALERDVPMLIEGIDLGEYPPLQQALDLAAEAWGARRAWFLTNGASQANRTAAIAARGLGPNILSQRSAHSSFSDGAVVTGSVPSFVLPSVDTVHGIAHGVSPAALDAALTEAARDGRPADAVYIVSPSYFGSVSDVRGLAEVAHAHRAPLIVDAAWGAHFGFHPELPESPTRLGADLVISSTHKLAGSLTQSAMLHLGEGPFADRLEPLVERALGMTSSTSTSALLRASLDIARHALATGEQEIGRSIEWSERFRDALRAASSFGVVSDEFYHFADVTAVDPLRVPIDVSATGVSGHWMAQRMLESEGVHVEMSTATTMVAVIGAGKTPDLDRIMSALHAVNESDAARLERATQGLAVEFPQLPKPGPQRMTPREGFFADTEIVSSQDAVGRISADTLAAYPPGIPNAMPGEEITAETVEFLRAVAASPSGYVRGALDPLVDTMRVIREH